MTSSIRIPDTLAASDAFGALLEQAHDELCTRGRDGFRRAADPGGKFLNPHLESLFA